MEQNVYRSELERLGFTEAGKAALTDALMAEQVAPDARHRSPWLKRGAIAALAAVLLVGTAAAVTLPLWEDYFGPMDEGQLAVVERLSETLPDAVTSNGATMTPLAAFGGHGTLYLMLDVEALAKEAGAPAQAANMVLLGAAIPMLGLSFETIRDAAAKVFARKGEEIVAKNIAALAAGYSHSSGTGNK